MRGNKIGNVALAFKKTYGPRVAGAASRLSMRDRRIRTGSLALDYALGGGVGIGRNTLFFGEKSGGKTTSAIRVMANAQGLCRNCYRPAKDVTSVEPDAAALEADPDARWSASGMCTCFAEGVYAPDEPTHLDFGETKGSKKFKAKLSEWRNELTLNSYEEVICAFIDTEDAFDAAWTDKLGADSRRIFFARPMTGEEGVDMVNALISSSGCDFLIIDSLAHLTPRKEYEESAETWQQGLQARIVNKGIRKWVSGGILAKRSDVEVTQIWINQTRQKIGVMFGDPTVKPAGKGQDFAAHAEVKFYASKVETIDEVYGSKKEVITVPVSERFKFKTTKNKIGGTRDVIAEYTQLTRDTDSAAAGSIIEVDYVFKMAMHYLVEKTKTGYAIGDDLNYTSQKGLMEALRDDEVLFGVIKDTLLRKMLKEMKRG